MLTSQRKSISQRMQQPTMADQTNNNQTDQQSRQSSNSNDNNNNNNDLGKTGFFKYKNMNQCLSDQTTNHNLTHDVALSTCVKMMQMHLKNQQQITQQSDQQLQQKAASVENRRDEWKKLRSIIIQSPRY